MARRIYHFKGTYCLSDITIQTFVILFRLLRSPVEEQLGNSDQKEIWRREQTASS